MAFRACQEPLALLARTEKQDSRVPVVFLAAPASVDPRVPPVRVEPVVSLAYPDPTDPLDRLDTPDRRNTLDPQDLK